MNPPDQPAFTITGEAKEGTLAPMSFYAPALAPTPRTDAVAARYQMDYGTELAVPTNFARTLERELVEARSERDLAITRVACILWSGAIDKHTCGDVQKWADYYTAELTRLRAEVERWKTVAAQMTAEREHNANEASRLRAEVERLTTKIGNQADRIRYLEGAINHATGTPLSKANARAEKAEAALKFISDNGGTKHETECGTISCNGLWCAEQARAAMKGTP
jgi:hypothetical protein